MITIDQHIDQQHGGNVSAFARSVGSSRPTVYSWLQRGSMWHAGRVWDPVTPTPIVVQEVAVNITFTHEQEPLLLKGGYGAEWVKNGGNIMLQTIGMGFAVHLNAADLAAMAEALNNET